MRKFQIKRRDRSRHTPSGSAESCPTTVAKETHQDCAVRTKLEETSGIHLTTRSPKKVLVMEQDIVEQSSMIDPEMLPDLLQTLSHSSDGGDSPTSCSTVPCEVTALVDDETQSRSSIRPDPRHIDFPSLQKQIEDYTRDLEIAQQHVQRLSFELQKSQLQAAQLLQQNRRLLADLQTAIAKEDMSLEFRILKQELILLKGSLFCGLLYVFWGGRPYVMAALGIVWLLVDFAS